MAPLSTFIGSVTGEAREISTEIKILTFLTLASIPLTHNINTALKYTSRCNFLSVHILSGHEADH